MRVEVVAMSYGAGAIFFGLFTLLLLTAWRGRLQGGLLVVATSVSALWCGAVAGNAVYPAVPVSALQVLEIFRSAVWLAFLLRLMGYSWPDRGGVGQTLRVVGPLIACLCIGLAALVIADRLAYFTWLQPLASGRTIALGHVLIAVSGLALVEQVYRNTRVDYRWAVKFACFGIGGIFVFDLYLYSKALLFRSLDIDLWVARGAINALVVPMIAVSAARNPQWSLDIFVSRHIVFHSAALLGTGAYLILMAAAGFYLRTYGDSWGAVAQAVFLFGALALLAVLLLSGQLRSRLRIFLSKHFYRNQYDYREEWLRFTRTLSAPRAGDALHHTVTRAIAQIVESPGGMMWVESSAGEFRPASPGDAWLTQASVLKRCAPLAKLMAETGWVIFLDDLEHEIGTVEGFELPGWFEDLRQPWIVVPLMHADSLLAFIVLRKSSTKRQLNWEDRDLLKTVGQQAASHMALWLAREELAEARQFEAFNRLSAFVVHDLKNLVAQLSLVVRNAKRHMHSPGFMEDAIDTVENAASKMNRMLAQLRKGSMSAEPVRTFDLDPVLGAVVAARAVSMPVPVIVATEPSLRVRAEPDRFAAVLEHIVQNAQDATVASGSVSVSARKHDDFVVVEIADTGVGMDEAFIAQRLFRPFDTTKGNAGMGVGVYETKEYFESIGGRIEVSSELGTGSTFSLWVPLASAIDELSSQMEVAT